MHISRLGPMPKTFDYDPPREPWLSVIYEDEHIVVFDKPSGLLSVPGKPAELFDSLQSRALERYPGAGTIHRLDKDTSGIMVMAKSKWAHARIGMQFEKRQTRKTYIARVFGEIAGQEGLIDLPLATDWENKPRQRVDHERGRPAQSRWRVIAREEDATRVELEPLTGRTHQLRVHMREIGHPILGDVFYATGPALEMAPRLQLHAHHLGFAHPETGEPIDFYSPVPF